MHAQSAHLRLVQGFGQVDLGADQRIVRTGIILDDEMHSAVVKSQIHMEMMVRPPIDAVADNVRNHLLEDDLDTVLNSWIDTSALEEGGDFVPARLNSLQRALKT